MKSYLSLSKVMTIQVLFPLRGFRNFKTFYLGYVCKHLRGYFPQMVNYNRMVELCSDSMLHLVKYLKNFALGDCSGISFIDSTPLSVCHNRRIHSHKVFDGLAIRGQCFIGWFYSFKVHLVTNDRGGMFDFMLIPGNVGDRKPQHMDVDSYNKPIGQEFLVKIKLSDKQKYMFQKAVHHATILIVIAILSSSCVNLKAVGNYSREAVAGMEQFERLPYGFEMHCEATCLDKNIRDRNVNPDPCDCSADKRADSINSVIYSAAHDYFHGLAMLADNEQAQLNTAGLTGTLVAGDFGPVSLNTEQVEAYSLLSNTLIRALTDKFRSRALSDHVARADKPVGILLEYLDLNLAGNLYQKLEVRKRRLKGFYFDLARNPELSLYEQTKFVEDYYRNLEDLSVRQETLQGFSGIIKEMQEGHKKLAKQLKNPKDPHTRQELSQAGSRLHTTIKDFKAIGGWDN